MLALKPKNGSRGDDDDLGMGWPRATPRTESRQQTGVKASASAAMAAPGWEKVRRCELKKREGSMAVICVHPTKKNHTDSISHSLLFFFLFTTFFFL